MLTESELKDIRRELESSRNPLFIFHDDGDGVCSFLQCYRYIKRGHGELIKRLFTLKKKHVEIINKYEPDKVFVLDIPEIDQEFIDNIDVPIIWIDHHPVLKRKGVKYFNPRIKSPEKNYPVSYLCYKVLKKDLWISMLGSVSDYYLPEFKDKFVEKYPDLLSKEISTPGQALFETELGKLIRILSFSLKGPKYRVNQNISKIMKMESPYEIQELINEKLLSKYQKLKSSALNQKPEGKFFIYKFSGKLSFIGELANEIIHLFPDKIVVIARENNDEIKISLRSRKYKLLKALNKALCELGSRGGGHELACGTKIKSMDWEKFIQDFKNNIV